MLLRSQELFSKLSDRLQKSQIQLQDLDLAGVAPGPRDDVARRRDALGFAAAAQIDLGPAFGKLNGGLEADSYKMVDNIRKEQWGGFESCSIIKNAINEEPSVLGGSTGPG